MCAQRQVSEALESLRGVADNLSERSAGVPSVVVGEIQLLASQLAALEREPVSLSTKDFEYPVGEEVPIPEAGNDILSVFERIIDEQDFLPVFFLQQGVQIQQSVARVTLTQAHRGLPAGSGWATGFLVSPSLFLTNNHVIPDLNFAKKIRMQFNFQLGAEGIEQLSESFLPALNDVFHTNAALDYTLIRLRPNQTLGNGAVQTLPGDHWGFIPLNLFPQYRQKQHFNVIQHPRGRHKEVALQDNEIQTLFANVVRYTADTEPGSSGSPVFDNLWQLVALHHAGGERDENGKWINNQGIRVDRIIEDLQNDFAGGDQEHVLTELGIEP